MFFPCSELGIFMYRTRNSMNNLSSYCRLVDAKIRASDKDLPVSQTRNWYSKFIGCTLIVMVRISAKAIFKTGYDTSLIPEDKI